MSLSESQAGILACERLKVSHSHRLQMQSFIPNALQNLAREVANDPLRRRLLVTNQDSVTATIITSTYNSYASLIALQTTPGIMFEYLQYGTIYYLAATKTWTNTSVDTGADTITITNHGYVTGQSVRLTTAGSLPAGLVTGLTYYVIVVDTNTIQLATTYADATAGIPVNMTTAGSGTSTMTAYQKDICQWQESPTQASLASDIPFNYVYIWLEQGLLYTNRTNGTFAFSVQFIPTLATLPYQLENDAIDAIVQLAVTSGFSPLPEAAR